MLMFHPLLWRAPAICISYTLPELSPGELTANRILWHWRREVIYLGQSHRRGIVASALLLWEQSIRVCIARSVSAQLLQPAFFRQEATGAAFLSSTCQSGVLPTSRYMKSTCPFRRMPWSVSPPKPGSPGGFSNSPSSISGAAAVKP